MGTSSPTVIETVSSRKTLPTSKRQHRSAELKLQIVQETLAPGASVARVARARGVNANQVFGWRRLYLAGRLGDPKPEMKLLPVRVSGGVPAPLPMERSSIDFAKLQPSTIHIELRQAQVRIEGSADPALVRVLLECLRA